MLILIRGAGDLASGVALRLVRCGLKVILCELPQPLAVRRLVAFSEAIYAGETTVEGVAARRVKDPQDTLKVLTTLARGQIPVLIDPEGEAIRSLHPGVVIDARMLKRPVELPAERVSLLVGLGPGFTAGANCHCAIETQRGHTLGRVYWQGGPLSDTGIPEGVLNKGNERVLRAPLPGELVTQAEIGARVTAGQPLAEIAGQQLLAPFAGVLRGLLRSGQQVQPGMKIGDLDPRGDLQLCRMVSDKSQAVAGGVLEALLSKPELRAKLWA